MPDGALAAAYKQKLQRRARVAVRTAGDRMHDDLKERTPSLRWSYGHPLREFRPHRALNGVTFANYDDRKLAHSGWPGPRLFPGDHVGCVCGADIVFDRRAPNATGWTVRYSSTETRFEARVANGKYDPAKMQPPSPRGGSGRVHGGQVAVHRRSLSDAVLLFHERVLTLRRWDAELTIALARAST